MSGLPGGQARWTDRWGIRSFFSSCWRSWACRRWPCGCWDAGAGCARRRRRASAGLAWTGAPAQSAQKRRWPLRRFPAKQKIHSVKGEEKAGHSKGTKLERPRSLLNIAFLCDFHYVAFMKFWYCFRPWLFLIWLFLGREGAWDEDNENLQKKNITKESCHSFPLDLVKSAHLGPVFSKRFEHLCATTLLLLAGLLLLLGPVLPDLGRLQIAVLQTQL